jgi:hypothetical protein
MIKVGSFKSIVIKAFWYEFWGFDVTIYKVYGFVSDRDWITNG